MGSVIWLITTIINLYIYVIFFTVILGLLIHFDIVNRHNTIVWKLDEFFRKVTDPILNPIRKFMPSLGGVDISPLIAILGLQFISMLIKELYFTL